MRLILTTSGETTWPFANGCVRSLALDFTWCLEIDICALVKDQKRALRTATKAAGSAGNPSKEELREALQKVKDEQLPDSAEAKEQYFMQSVSVGEQLCARGKYF